MRKCLYPGSFDPVTKGHMDLIVRASEMYDEVVVAVLVNINKQGFLTVENRLSLLKKACASLPNVTIISFSGLTVDLAKQRNINVLLRGIRGTVDMEYEMAIAQANKALLPSLETVFLPASSQTAWVSSSAVREVTRFQGDISPFVPSSIMEDLTKIIQLTNK